jgi:hypothetical protein
MRRKMPPLALFVALSLLPSLWLHAAPETGRYVVRPGDTLRGLATRYLGSEGRWEEIWKLNPEVKDPHFLRPGDRLKILLDAELPERTARLLQVHRDVDQNPAPLTWKQAARDDLLLTGDGLRTQENSTADLEFRGGEQMSLSQNSLIYLREDRRQQRVANRQGIEIVRGQADLEGPAKTAASSSDVEIILGNTRARPRSTASGPAQARARRPESGGAKVMVFKGEGEVEAQGAAVELTEGTGTSVPEKGPPSPPEKLLPAPTLLAPPQGARLEFANPLLDWQAVPGAATYTVEICSDEKCAGLLHRLEGLTTDSWRPDKLPRGDLFWRVVARSVSELDGYGSVAALSILSDEADLVPPTGDLRVQGPSAQLAGKLLLGAGARFDLVAEDAQSGIALREASVDGEVQAEGLAGGWTAGSHTVAARLVDHVGNATTVPAVSFLYDPDPPAISWTRVAPDWRDSAAVGQKAWPEAASSPVLAPTERPKKRFRKKEPKPPSVPLAWSFGGWAWQALDGTWSVPGGVSGLVLRSTGRPVLLEGPGLQVDREHRLVVNLEDAGAGIESVRFGLELEAGRQIFVLEARDRLGNTRQERWPLTVL